ncbi:MAG TPA: efflux RND transporter periplasmic adaptor subunit [Pseudolabrys sp.]|nr:efflux RND transporter periplasmic adaptor subunit [Pseudolabrys sp.]
MSFSRIWTAGALLAALALGACDNGAERPVQGWVEAELVFVSPDEMGRIEELRVKQGDHVNSGDLLFTVDPDLQQADVMMNEASLVNAQKAYDRAQELLKTAAGTQKTLEDAEAALRTAQARLNSSRTRLQRRRAFAPADGTIQQVYYRPGELVPAGRPVIALLPPPNLKIRFFVPEERLAQIKYGDTVTVNCDHCQGDATAKVSFIASSAEFTPPVIYSLEERSKLVYLVEARPTHPENFRVGQPVDVVLPQGQPK